jgi:outer membrane immunogenic protein
VTPGGRSVKKLLLAGVAAGMLCGAPALAAPPAAPIFNWTGFYFGGNAGYGWGNGNRTVAFTGNEFLSTVDTCGLANGGTCPPSTSFDSRGPVGGLQVGYNWQLKQNWLAGIETDFDWSRIKGTGSSNFILGNFPASPRASNFQADQNLKWFGTVRGRLGFLPTNNVLFYGTAGFAYGRVDERVVLNSQAGPGDFAGGFGFICVSGPNCFLGSSSRTAAGWTAGGGFEYLVLSNVSLKAEYLYVNLAGANAVKVVAVSANGQPMPASFTAAYSGANFHVVRAGINFHF